MYPYYEFKIMKAWEICYDYFVLIIIIMKETYLLMISIFSLYFEITVVKFINRHIQYTYIYIYTYGSYKQCLKHSLSYFYILQFTHIITILLFSLSNWKIIVNIVLQKFCTVVTRQHLFFGVFGARRCVHIVFSIGNSPSEYFIMYFCV